MTLLTKILILVGTLVTVTVLALGYYFNQHSADQMKEQKGEQALHIAQSIAGMPAVVEAFELENPENIIQPIAEGIRQEIGAEFIVVGNLESIRYSHPVEDRIGEQMVGGDNERAFAGESYVSEAEGSLGPSVRGKTPVLDIEGNVIGVVSVGFLQEDVQLTAGEYLTDTWYIIGGLLAFGWLGAGVISLLVKRSIYGLEPHEIGRLYKEREAVIQSVHEGLIAIDANGKIQTVNQAAAQHMNDDEALFVGRDITSVFPHTGLLEVLENGKPQFNQDLWIGGEYVIVNRVPIYHNHTITGAVATFRNRTEMLELSRELTKIKEYAEGLRAQTHEFSNKLYTISGLLQLSRPDEAIAFINKEAQVQQDSIQFLIYNVEDTLISAVLLGKMNRARELGVQLEVESESSLQSSLNEDQREHLVTIIGNVVENAVEAALSCMQERRPTVRIAFTDFGDDLVFEIEDSGPGFKTGEHTVWLQQGYSSKGKNGNRGVGLTLVQTAVDELGGTLSFEESDLGGACMIIAVPKAQPGRGKLPW
ncbi:ATP-binding protein [Salsuginibacillus halophilus]|uniref:ATP-binding protein n=1 Tax=Salsuginibacillus halophilus TaxID=517424 RepID=UPI001FE754BA|nr:sensor histidine kinase [Salsuginibacillus halophilus]